MWRLARHSLFSGRRPEHSPPTRALCQEIILHKSCDPEVVGTFEVWVEFPYGEIFQDLHLGALIVFNRRETCIGQRGIYSRELEIIDKDTSEFRLKPSLELVLDHTWLLFPPIHYATKSSCR